MRYLSPFGAADGVAAVNDCTIKANPSVAATAAIPFAILLMLIEVIIMKLVLWTRIDFDIIFFHSA